MMYTKRHKIEVVKTWITELSCFDSYCGGMMEAYNGDELDKMTIKQLDMLLNYIKAVYHMAYSRGVELGKSFNKSEVA